jgi:hypothetical protein
MLRKTMPLKKTLGVKEPVVVTAVLRPVASRLNRIEDLLTEVRLVLDLHLKRIDKLQRQVDTLSQPARGAGPATRRGRG